MKFTLFLILFLLFSCASRKTQVKRYVDEIISSRQGSVIKTISNTNLSEDLTISFRSLEYDTAGRVTKETTGDIRQKKEETKIDSVTKQDSLIIQSNKITEEIIKEKKKPGVNNIAIGCVLTLLFISIIYFYKRAK